MNTETQAQSAVSEPKAKQRVVSGDAVVGYAVLGCLVAGTIGVFKAMSADGSNAASCILASAAAFGAVCYIYLRKD